MRKKAEREKVIAPDESASKRTYLKQADVPGATLEEALRIPQAILDHYAGRATAPLFVAKALNVDPKGSQLKLLSGAAIAYGLIEGGSQAASISVTELSRRILRPKEEGSDLMARREAVLRPRVFGEFLRTYDNNPFPRQDIAINVLEELGVPRDKAAEVFERIEATARSVGFLDQIKDKIYVTLGTVGDIEPTSSEEPEHTATPAAPKPLPEREPLPPTPAPTLIAPKAPEITPSPQRSSLALAIADDERRRRVFITHGKNRDLVEPIRKLLEYGELVPIISVEKQTVSKPVPEKVMDDMRGCGAAIIHVDADRTIRDAAGDDHVLLNPNVLIEIGAAMAFYGRRFILLVREGVKLPSNLQGLYEVRYSGDILDATATIKLLEAIKDIKNYALPTDASGADS
jgi:hypothetical protein